MLRQMKLTVRKISVLVEKVLIKTKTHGLVNFMYSACNTTPVIQQTERQKET